MDSLIKALPAILRATEGSNEVIETICRVAWNHAVGESLRHNALAIGLNDRTLIVGVSDRIWQKQLQAMMGQLIFRVNSVIGQRLIKAIEFRIEPEALEKSRTRQRVQGGSTLDVPEELLVSSGSIGDPQLRRLFLAAAVTCLNRRKTLETTV